MPNPGRSLRGSVLAALSLLFLFGTATQSSATGNIVKSDFKGTWQMTLRGTTPCGFVSALATITFGTTGSGTGTLQTHGDCGDETLTGQTFTVNTLTAKGTGTATLTCGPGCAWHFTIQVAPDRSKFHLAIVSDPGSFLEGVAIVRSPAENIVPADLKGDWHVTLFGRQVRDCGSGPAPFTFTGWGRLTLNHTGTGDMPTTLHTSCGDFEDPVNPFTILGLNADGSGTAHLNCATDCEFNLTIQVSPDRSTFAFVDVSTTNPGFLVAGVATRRSTGGNIVKANLAGPWQFAIGRQDECGAASGIGTVSLNAKAASTNFSLNMHTELCGDVTIPFTFTVQTLDPDGAGTAHLSCGVDCTLDFRIQVAPDRSTFNLVELVEQDDYSIGTAVHK